MKNTIIQIATVTLIAIVLSSCSLFGGKPKAEEQQTEVEASSTQECDALNGEAWSLLLEKCIRPSELGRAATALEGDAVAFAVFSADSLQCELFITDQDMTHLLDRRTARSGHAWNVEDDDTYNVRFVEGKLQITRRANIEFAE